jgi:tetratricopeptide (TPR) repeat protein
VHDEIGPGHGFGYLTAGMACALLGKPEEALAHLADGRRIEPQSPYQHYGWNWAGGAYLQLDDLAAAEAAYDASRALNPEAGYIYCIKALAVRQLGRTDEARELMREARRRDPAATLELWELRNTRWNPQGPSLDASLTHLRALWAETEGAS